MEMDVAGAWPLSEMESWKHHGAVCRPPARRTSGQPHERRRSGAGLRAAGEELRGRAAAARAPHPAGRRPPGERGDAPRRCHGQGEERIRFL